MPNAEATPRPVISVVVPMFNESENVEAFYGRTAEALDRIGEPWEIVCVNDGSRDDTLLRLVALHRRDPRVKVVNLSRNFGKEIALSAGLDHARGDAVVPIDADLQDPPELIEEMVARWREGWDVVYAQRTSRSRSIAAGVPSRLPSLTKTTSPSSGSPSRTAASRSWNVGRTCSSL